MQKEYDAEFHRINNCNEILLETMKISNSNNATIAIKSVVLKRIGGILPKMKKPNLIVDELQALVTHIVTKSPILKPKLP